MSQIASSVNKKRKKANSVRNLNVKIAPSGVSNIQLSDIKNDRNIRLQNESKFNCTRCNSRRKCFRHSNQK